MKNPETLRVMNAITSNEGGLRDEIASELHDLDLLSEERHLAFDRIKDIVEAWDGIDVPEWVIDLVDSALGRVDWQAIADECIEAYDSHAWER